MINRKSVYPHTKDIAKAQNESRQYVTSYIYNVECSLALEAAISDAYEGESYSTDALADAIGDFGMRRVKIILANTVRRYPDADGISDYNKSWANGFHIPLEIARNQYECVVHEPDSCVNDMIDIVLRLERNGIEKEVRL